MIWSIQAPTPITIQGKYAKYNRWITTKIYN